MHTTYTGDRVRLRPFKDKEEFLALLRAQSMSVSEHWGPGWIAEARSGQRFEEDGYLAAGGESVFAIELVATAELIGSEAAHTPGQAGLTGMIGTAILDTYQHQGYGIAAKHLAMCFIFENFPVERVIAVTASTHQRAIRGLELCGMHLEARYVSHFNQGRYVDRLEYVIFREEWEQLPYRQSVKRG